jgi:hypothetical protein
MGRKSGVIVRKNDSRSRRKRAGKKKRSRDAARGKNNDKA